MDGSVRGSASAINFNHVPAEVQWAITNWPDDLERGSMARFCERHENQ